MKSSGQEVSAITARLSAHIAGATRTPLPREVAARARLHQALLKALWRFDELKDVRALRRLYAG